MLRVRDLSFSKFNILAILVSTCAMLVGFSTPSVACIGASEELTVDPGILLERSTGIYLVRTTSASLFRGGPQVRETTSQTAQRHQPGDGTAEVAGTPLRLQDVISDIRRPRDKILYQFEVQRAFRGNEFSSFELMFEETSRPSALQNDDFNHHSDEVFWSATGGRTGIEADCQIRPSFEVGSTYLVLLGPDIHVKAFEKIEGRNDRWLSFVIEHLDH